MIRLSHWLLMFGIYLVIGTWCLVIVGYHFPNSRAKKLFFIPMAA